MLSNSIKISISVAFLLMFVGAQAQEEPIVPKVHKNIFYGEKGIFLINPEGDTIYAESDKPRYSLEDVKGRIEGHNRGLHFEFGQPVESGTLYYGFIPSGDSHHPLPVYFKNPAKIEDHQAIIPIADLDGKYDMINWEENEEGLLGYRVVNEKGEILYDGRIRFTGTGPFQVAPTIVEGPFVDQITADRAIISFRCSEKVQPEVNVGDRRFSTVREDRYHEFTIGGLQANTPYNYSVQIGDYETQEFTFSTAPAEGTRSAFTFAYASDSRNGQGGGERNIHGANAYIMKKIAALAIQQDAAFMQFSGDLINGYLSSRSQMDLQYSNWKRAIEPFGHHLPVYEAMGNHEALIYQFLRDGNYYVSIDKFPFSTSSAETAFADHFVNPENGPKSEDGAPYDPEPDQMNFPDYSESVYYYTYDNVAMVVLNSDYWYAPSSSRLEIAGGNLHGYIMDQQLQWLEGIIGQLESDSNIDHIFLTLHTPFFPNGGHVQDDMWYNGNNSFRPYVAGKPVEKGIIERRDELLDIIANKSRKTLAILTGDEHNFALTEVNPDMPRYPENYQAEKLELDRTIYQINNGAAGAPYYAKEETPWMDNVSGFTTQNALVLIHVDGANVKMVVLNPDTLEVVMEKELR